MAVLCPPSFQWKERLPSEAFQLWKMRGWVGGFIVLLHVYPEHLFHSFGPVSFIRLAGLQLERDFIHRINKLLCPVPNLKG